MQPLTDLGPSLEKLYAVFAHYERTEHMESCPCCRGPESVRPLYEHPLRELGPESLHFYAFCAMTTMGDVDDFRHFLPRIIELLNDDGFLANIDREVVLGKLRYGQWETWPQEEQAAVREYLSSLWRAVLRTPPDETPCEKVAIGDWLCALARAEGDLSPYLEHWLADRSSSATANLARFVAEHKEELASAQVPSGYWEDTPMQWRQVAQWAKSAGLLDARTDYSNECGSESG